jgi:GT2 family glycosyltransferase
MHRIYKNLNVKRIFFSFVLLSKLPGLFLVNLKSSLLSPSVAIVILNWNGKKHLAQFLPSVIKTTYANIQIIVADNASDDDSIPFLAREYPQIRVIALAKNFGFAGGYNEALKQVKSDYYVLLNSDVEVTPGWIGPVIALMEKDPAAGACQPKILSYSHKELFEYAGACGGWIDYLGYPFARGRVFDTVEKDSSQYDAAELVFWASGAALFVKADIFHQLKGFDSYFFAHMEEIDLCWRLQRSGYTVYVCPESVVYHLGGGTLGKEDPRKVFLNFRNNLIMLAKNLETSQSLWKIPFRFLLDLLSAFRFLFSGSPGQFLAVIRAQLAFIKWLFMKKEARISPRHLSAKLHGWFNGSVVWAYFVSGRKTFAQIVQNKS